MRLQQRQARETGICPVREELYGQCFGMYATGRLKPQSTVIVFTLLFCSVHFHPILHSLVLLISFGIFLSSFLLCLFIDEIIRETTINCAERGALLLRIRDEIRMTLRAYQNLYESSIAFGMRKALMAEQKKSEFKAKIKLATAEVRELEKVADTLQNRCADLESSEKQRYAQDEEKHQQEVTKLKTVNDDLREQLENALSVKR